MKPAPPLPPLPPLPPFTVALALLPAPLGLLHERRLGRRLRRRLPLPPAIAALKVNGPDPISWRPAPPSPPLASGAPGPCGGNDIRRGTARAVTTLLPVPPPPPAPPAPPWLMALKVREPDPVCRIAQSPPSPPLPPPPPIAVPATVPESVEFNITVVEFLPAHPRRPLRGAGARAAATASAAAEAELRCPGQVSSSHCDVNAAAAVSALASQSIERSATAAAALRGGVAAVRSSGTPRPRAKPSVPPATCATAATATSGT